MPTPAIRLLIVDDHVLIRLGLITIFNDEPDITVAGEAGNGRRAVELFTEIHPDVVLLDLKMPGLNGVETIRLLKEKSPTVRVVVLTTLDQEEEIFRALEAGAMGYLLKDMRKEELVEAIRAVHRGERWLAPLAGSRLAERVVRKELNERELEIIKFLVQGRSNKEIAAASSLSEDSIKWHMKNLLRKLGTHDRTQAAVLAIQRGLVKI